MEGYLAHALESWTISTPRNCFGCWTAICCVLQGQRHFQHAQTVARGRGRHAVTAWQPAIALGLPGTTPSNHGRSKLPNKPVKQRSLRRCPPRPPPLWQAGCHWRRHLVPSRALLCSLIHCLNTCLFGTNCDNKGIMKSMCRVRYAKAAKLSRGDIQISTFWPASARNYVYALGVHIFFGFCIDWVSTHQNGRVSAYLRECADGHV